jgi:transcriptional antiterminator RfaH
VYWACAQIETRRARLAQHFLEQRGFEVYAPQIRERRKKTSPLFPGYLFVSITLQWYAARWCPGVIRLVTHGGDHPAAVPPGIIDDIRSRERGGFVRLPRRRPRVGDLVQIVRGPFVGLMAIYDGMSGPERVMVLLSALGGQPRLNLPAADIEPVS